MALDIGEKRIGVAISDPLRITANSLPVITYQKEKEAMDKILEIIDEYSPKEIVVGLPKNMNGSLGFKAKEVMKFTETLKNNLSNKNIPIIYQDERLTTKEAERFLLEADLSRAKRKKYIDSLSAKIILLTYMTQMSTNEENR